MKKFVKILCCPGMVAVMTVPIFAEDVSLMFNQVRISLDGKTITSWGENTDGDDSVPSSILYKDTTYVPLRWVSKNMNQDICWNGDSKTVGIFKKAPDRCNLVCRE